MKNNIQILEWDTNFFGFLVAKVDLNSLTPNKLSAIIQQLKNEKVCLAYFIAKLQDNLSIETVSSIAAPIDVKLFFEIDLKASVFSFSENVSVYTETKPSKELYDLAETAGAFSRFNRDKKFPQYSFNQLYNVWIENEVQDKENCKVFVYRQNGKLCALVSLKKRAEKAILSLVAVEENYQGKGVGRKIIEHVLAYSKSIGFTVCEVAAQECNQGAVAFYKSVGFSIVQQQVYFHIWL